MGITERQLQNAIKAGATHHGTDRDAYFALLYLRSEFPILTDDRAVSQVAFQPSVTGLNAFHIDRESKNLLLYCFRWTTSSYEVFTEPFNTLLTSGIDLIFAPPQTTGSWGPELDDLTKQLLGEAPSGRSEPLLNSLRAQLFEHRELVRQVFVHFVFNGDVHEVERSEVVRQLREELGKKTGRIQIYFDSRDISVASAFVSERSNLRNIAPVPPSREHALHLDHVVETFGPSGELMRVGFARLADLGAMLSSIGPAFLERNIRAGLSEDEAPNRAITDSLKRMLLTEEEDPRTFVFHHNGVTMAAERCGDGNSDGEVLLSSPRLLNGAQTVTTFERFAQATPLRNNSQRLQEVKVLCKIITRAQREFITRVTINNNRQNPVMPWHLRANDLIQVQLQDWFARELGIYYERQENAFASLEDDDLIRLQVVENKAIKLLLLASTYLAADGRIDKMSHLREVFESDRIYDEVFNDSRLRANPRYVLLCYKTHRVIAKLLEQFGEKTDTRYAFLYRARNLIWALLCQSFLNDKRQRDRAADEFGWDLVVGREFRELMERYARAKVRPILNALVSEEPYASYRAAEKYGFLSTRAIFDRAMEMAKEKYGWRHRSLR